MTNHKFGACVFDAYGTVFDAHSAVGRLKKSVGERAGELSQVWRTENSVRRRAARPSRPLSLNSTH